MLRFTLICIVICVFYNIANADTQKTITSHPTSSTMYSEINIAFGSNFYPNSTNKDETFEKILETKPDVFLWVGETLVERSRGKHYGQQLMKLKSREDYSHFIEQVPVSGVEDLSQTSSDVRAKYLKFLDEDSASPRWNSLELFQSFWIKSNPTSSHESASPKRVKILILDVNMFEKASEEISPNQFAWLEAALKEKADDHFLTIIASGYQVLPHDKMYEVGLDMEAKIKLLRLIRKSPVPVLIISGAAFYPFGEVIKFPCSAEEDLEYNLYEITSAGMNSQDFEHVELYNKFTVGQTFSKLQNRVYEPNFGHIKIVYNHMTQSPEVSVELINQEGENLVAVKADMTRIKGKKKNDSNDLSVCSKNLYSNHSIFKSAISNMPHLLFDPRMRIYILAGVSFLLFLFVASLFGLTRMNNAKRTGASSPFLFGRSTYGLDEYERYHMD